MGMGEPLDNLDAVLKAIRILTAEWGFGFSPKKVTVSTIGILDGFEKLLDKTSCRIALSVHSPYPEERARIILGARLAVCRPGIGGDQREYS